MADNDPAVDSSSPVEMGTVTKTFDWSETNPSTAVVETVSAATGTEPTELDTLQHTIDADSLDTLVQDAAGQGTFQVEFLYNGTGVRITGAGTVRVTLD